MYDEHSVQIPEAHPSQKPIPKPRSMQEAQAMSVGSHAWDKMQERDYTQEQVRQTRREGHEQADPHGNPNVSRFFLNSIAHANLRRGIVVDRSKNDLITVLTRTETTPPASTPKAQPSSTKAKKKAQLAKKRARSNGSQEEQ